MRCHFGHCLPFGLKENHTMSAPTIQDILPLLQMPSRYLGCEVNRVKKAWESVPLHLALAFPDLYEIATSHFGIQILYDLVNAQPDILAERVYAPAVDLEDQLRRQQIPLCSLESGTPLKQFDIVGFSLLYELNYTNVVNMLDLADIPLLASDRRADDPFLIAGGPCTCNPEPVADFFDALVVGDGEAVILQITDAWRAWRRSSGSKAALLERWSRIKGVYIPVFFDVAEDAAGRQLVIAKRSAAPFVEKAVVADLNDAPVPPRPIIPFGRPVHDRLRMEIARGCTRGCRFCQAGMIYRPVRERRPETILASAMQVLQETGYEDLSLLSLSTGDYSCIAPLIERIMQAGETSHVAVSLPSLRAGSLTPELMETIRKVRKTGFTIAPEAGSQRLRNVINKNITEADIVATVENAFSWGWKVIKLYFMIGLPTETQADLEAIVALVKRLTTVSGSDGRKGRINVSVATFVPKPHTPFQWAPQIDLETATQKMGWLKANLKIKNVQFKWQDPRVSRIEGVWSRGDRRLHRVLIEAWRAGCRFDGWTDFFDYDRWVAVFKACGIDPDRYQPDPTDRRSPLPWDHIRMGVDRAYLIHEYERALDGQTTSDCRTGSCGGCGVCDFEAVKPVTYYDHDMGTVTTSASDTPAPSVPPATYQVIFSKTGPARFLGHLEMVNIFIRAFRRAGIPVAYSRGFHPMPRLSFTDTIPMGMQSEDERMWIALTEAMDPQALVSGLQQQLPAGLAVVACRVQAGKKGPDRSDPLHYQVELIDGFFRQNDLEWFRDQPQVTITRKSKKSDAAAVDLKKAVIDLRLINARQALMTLGTDNHLMVRPAHVMQTVFNLTDHQIRTAIVTKRKATHV